MIVINPVMGGGLSGAKLALATATEADVLSGKTFYAGSGELRTGRNTPIYYNLFSETVSGSGSRNHYFTYTATGSTILLVLAYSGMSKGKGYGVVGTKMGITSARIANTHESGTKISYSGQVVRLDVAAADAALKETWYVKIFSQ